MPGSSPFNPHPYWTQKHINWEVERENLERLANPPYLTGTPEPSPINIAADHRPAKTTRPVSAWRNFRFIVAFFVGFAAMGYTALGSFGPGKHDGELTVLLTWIVVSVVCYVVLTIIGLPFVLLTSTGRKRH